MAAPPWQAYSVSAATDAPAVAFVSAGASRRAFVSLVRLELSSVRGLHPRLVRRRELDATVACDGEELPKRRGSPAADDVVTFSDATSFRFFLTRSSSAPCVALFKRAVPRAHRRTLAVVRRAGNAATVFLTLTAPLRAALRRFVKPRTVAVAVVPLGELRNAGEHMRQLPVLAVPRGMQLEPTGPARTTAAILSPRGAPAALPACSSAATSCAQRRRTAGTAC